MSNNIRCEENVTMRADYIKPRISTEEYQAQIPSLCVPKKINTPNKRRSRKKVESLTQVRDLRPGQTNAREGLIWSPSFESKDEELEGYLLFARTLSSGRVEPSPRSDRDEGEGDEEEEPLKSSRSDEAIEPFLEHLTRHALLTHQASSSGAAFASGGTTAAQEAARQKAQGQAKAGVLWNLGSGKEITLLNYYASAVSDPHSSRDGDTEEYDVEEEIGLETRKRPREDTRESQASSSAGERGEGGGRSEDGKVSWKSYFSPGPEILGCLPPAKGYGPPTAPGRQKKTYRSMGERALKRQWDDLVREIEAVLLFSMNDTKAKAGANNRTPRVNRGGTGGSGAVSLQASGLSGTGAGRGRAQLAALGRLLEKARALPPPRQLVDEALAERAEERCEQLLAALTAAERWRARLRDLLSPFQPAVAGYSSHHLASASARLSPKRLVCSPPASSVGVSPMGVRPRTPTVSPLLGGGYGNLSGMPSLILGSSSSEVPKAATKPDAALVGELTSLVEEAQAMPIQIDEAEYLQNMLAQASEYCGKVDRLMSLIATSREENAQMLEKVEGPAGLIPSMMDELGQHSHEPSNRPTSPRSKKSASGGESGSGGVQAAELVALLKEGSLLPVGLVQGICVPLQELHQEMAAMRARVDAFFLQAGSQGGGKRPTLSQALKLYGEAFQLGIAFPSQDRLAAAIAKASQWKKKALELEGEEIVELRELEGVLKAGQELWVAAGPLLGQLKARVEAGREWLRRARKVLSLGQLYQKGRDAEDSPSHSAKALGKIPIEKVDKLLEEGKSSVWYTSEYIGLSDLLAEARGWVEEVRVAVSICGGKRSGISPKEEDSHPLATQPPAEQVAYLKGLVAAEEKMAVELSLLPESKMLGDAIKVSEWCAECRSALDSRSLSLSQLRELLDSAKALRSNPGVGRLGNLGQEEDRALRIYQQAASVCDRAKKLVRRVKKEAGSVPYAQLKKLADDGQSLEVDLESELSQVKALVVPVEAFLVAYEDIFRRCGIKIVSTVIAKSAAASPVKKGEEKKNSDPDTDKISMTSFLECIEAGEDLDMEIPELNELIALHKSVADWQNRVGQWKYRQKAVRRIGGGKAHKKPTLEVVYALLNEGQAFPVDVAEHEAKVNQEIEKILTWRQEAVERLLDLTGKMKETGRQRVSLWVRKWDQIKAVASQQRPQPRRTTSSSGGEETPVLESDSSLSSLGSSSDREKTQAKARDARAKMRQKDAEDDGPETTESVTERDKGDSSSSEDELSDEEDQLDKAGSESTWELNLLAEEAKMQPVASQEEELVECALELGKWVDQVREGLGHPQALDPPASGTNSYYGYGGSQSAASRGLSATEVKQLLEDQPTLDNGCLRAHRPLANLLRKVCKIYGDYMVGFLEGLAAAEEWVASARRALAQDSTSLTDLENLLVGARKGQFVGSAEVRRVRGDLERSVAWYAKARHALKHKRPLHEVTKLLQEADRMKLHCEEQQRLKQAASQAKAWLIKVKKSGVESGKASVEELRELVTEAGGIAGVDLTEEKRTLKEAASSYCLCRTPQEEGAMVKCVCCPDQFHQGCVAQLPWVDSSQSLGAQMKGFVCLRCRLREVFKSAAKRVGAAIRRTLGEPPPEETHPRKVGAPSPPVALSDGGPEEGEAMDPSSWAILAAMRTGIMSFQRSRSGSCGMEVMAPHPKEKEEKVKVNPEPVPQFSQQNIKRWTLILVKVLGEPEETALAESKHFVFGRQGALLKQLSTKARQLQIAEAKTIRDSLECVRVMLWCLRALWLFRHRPRLSDLLRLVDAGSGLPFHTPEESHVLNTFQTFVSHAKAWELQVKKFLAPGGKRDYALGELEALLDKARCLPVVTRQEEVIQEVIEDGGHRYCVCRGPNDGSFMVQCDKCDSWYHGKCVNVNQNMEDDLDNYECPACAKKRGKSYAFGPIDLLTPFRLDSQSDEDDEEDSDGEETPDEDIIIAYSSLWPAFEIMGIDEKDFVAPAGKGGLRKSGSSFLHGHSNGNVGGKRNSLDSATYQTNGTVKRVRKSL